MQMCLLKERKNFIGFYKFLNQKIIFTEEDQEKIWSEKNVKMCHICEDEFILGAKKYCEVRNPNPTREDIEEQHNQFFRK